MAAWVSSGTGYALLKVLIVVHSLDAFLAYGLLFVPVIVVAALAILANGCTVIAGCCVVVKEVTFPTIPTIKLYFSRSCSGTNSSRTPYVVLSTANAASHPF